MNIEISVQNIATAGRNPRERQRNRGQPGAKKVGFKVSALILCENRFPEKWPWTKAGLWVGSAGGGRAKREIEKQQIPTLHLCLTPPYPSVFACSGGEGAKGRNHETGTTALGRP